MEVVELSATALTSIPDALAHSQSLRRLPAGLGANPSLIELDVEDVPLRIDAVRRIAGMRSLRWLNPGGAREIPDGIWHLPHLEFLGLARARNFTLPSSSDEFSPRLRSVDLSGTSIGELKSLVALQKLTQLQYLNLSDTPLGNRWPEWRDPLVSATLVRHMDS